MDLLGALPACARQHVLQHTAVANRARTRTDRVLPSRASARHALRPHSHGGLEPAYPAAVTVRRLVQHAHACLMCLPCCTVLCCAVACCPEQYYDDGDDWEAREMERRRQVELQQQQQQALASKRKRVCTESSPVPSCWDGTGRLCAPSACTRTCVAGGRQLPWLTPDAHSCCSRHSSPSVD